MPRAPSRSAFAALALVVLAACLLACAPSAKPTGLDRVREAGVLRWGADLQGGEPYVYEDPAHPARLVGFEVELAEALAGELGVRAELVQNDWSNLVPSLERGTFDVALNGLEITDARAGRVLFTRPYYVFAERLMARADDPSITTEPSSLRGNEPTSALDPERKGEVVRVLRRLAESGATMVIVTHEPGLARGLGDHALCLRDGRVAAEGAPADVVR